MYMDPNYKRGDFGPFFLKKNKVDMLPLLIGGKPIEAKGAAAFSVRKIIDVSGIGYRKN